MVYVGFFFQAEDGIRYLVRSRGLGDVYKRQNSTGATRLYERAGMYVASEFVTFEKELRPGKDLELSLIHI